MMKLGKHNLNDIYNTIENVEQMIIEEVYKTQAKIDSSELKPPVKQKRNENYKKSSKYCDVHKLNHIPIRNVDYKEKNGTKQRIHQIIGNVRANSKTKNH
ncbi:hypothetical protein DMUE_0491 [Dictyocoela muelleri]|nr:hypothetical protein DMUE_0491 [Dictyocoela muelleri]